jgi:hypothetical protein
MAKLRQTFKPGDRVEVRIGRNGGLRSWMPGVVAQAYSSSTTIDVTVGYLTKPFELRDVRFARGNAPKTSARGPRSTAPKLRPRGPKADRGPIRSEEYKAFVRTKPCMFCREKPPSDPHHVGRRGTGQKTDDLRCVPACVSNPATGREGCHDLYHRGDWSALLRRGTTWSAGPSSPTSQEQALALIHATQVDLLVEYMRSKAA